MRIGSYDEPVYLLKISSDPLDYLELRIKHSAGRSALRNIAAKPHRLTESGFPVSDSLEPSQMKAATGFVRAIFGLNEAIPNAINFQNRPGLSEEITKLGSSDMEIYQTPKPEKKVFADMHPQESREPLELGTEIDTSPAAYAHRAALAKKRRDLTEFYLTRKFIYPLALMGIMSDSAFATAVLSSDGFGIKDKSRSKKGLDSWQVRLETVKFFEKIVESVFFKFKRAKTEGLLPTSSLGFLQAILPITFEDLRDDILDLDAIAQALSQKGSGINDPDSDIRSVANEAVDKSLKTQKIIQTYLSGQGYMFPAHTN